MKVHPDLTMLPDMLQTGLQHTDNNLPNCLTLLTRALKLYLSVHCCFQCRLHIRRRIQLSTGAYGCQDSVTFSNIVSDGSITYTHAIILIDFIDHCARNWFILNHLWFLFALHYSNGTQEGHFIADALSCFHHIIFLPSLWSPDMSFYWRLFEFFCHSTCHRCINTTLLKINTLQFSLQLWRVNKWGYKRGGCWLFIGTLWICDPYLAILRAALGDCANSRLCYDLVYFTNDWHGVFQRR